MKPNSDDAPPRRSLSRTLLGGIFVTSGVLHFAFAQNYERVMPPSLPWHRALVYLSGACEIAGGAGLFPKQTRRAAGFGLILLLLAVWPANFQMLFNARREGKSALEQALLWLRLPLQIPLILWVWNASRDEKA